ncbi:TPA: hypothetical protein OOF68_005377 [Citrobacter freundii]|nr:hypothetical protein [Citrobacter freundii]
MKKLPLQGRTLALLAVIIPLLVLFIYVGLRSGPLIRRGTHQGAGIKSHSDAG